MLLFHMTGQLKKINFEVFEGDWTLRFLVLKNGTTWTRYPRFANFIIILFNCKKLKSVTKNINGYIFFFEIL